MSNATTPVHAPWGYEYLETQQQANLTWWWQVVQCLTLGGYFWDIVLSVPRDLEFIFHRRFNYVTCIFIINRISATLCLVGYFVLDSTTIVECHAIGVMVPVSEGITLFTSSALLAIRVWIVYREQIYVTVFMVAFLFPGPVLNIVAWVPLKSIILPNASGCGYADMPPSWAYLPFLFQSIFDLLVFVLCLAKLLTRSDLSIQNIYRRPPAIRMRIKREFIQGGFAYYIPNVIIQITTLVLLTQGANSLQYITTPCATAVASAQSLRITRKLWKLGVSGQHTENLVVQDVDEERKICTSPGVDTSTSRTGENLAV